MAAHIPEGRHVINGRTFDREWQPCAVEHYRRPSRGLRTVSAWLLLLALTALLYSIGSGL
jgi:hypothetical protein